MALDGIVISAIVSELQACIGARIHKIHQPTDRELIIQLRGGGNGKLLLSANPTYPRVHFTEQNYLNPQEPPMFCMLLRKYCEGGVIEGVRQIGRERIIHIDIRQRDELGDLSIKTLIIELMGRHSNIILIDPVTGLIHDGIHHITPSISSYRIIMPGNRYVTPPEQSKSDPLEVTGEETFSKLIANLESEESESGAPAGGLSEDASKQLVSAFSGLSPLLASELVFRAKSESAESAVTYKELWTVFKELMTAVRQERFVPEIVTDANGKSFFSVTELTSIEGETKRFDSISRCLEAFYSDKALRDAVKQRATDLIRFLHNEKNKNEKKLEKLQETIEEAKDADKFRILGELVTTYMHSINKGDSQTEVVNYYDENQANVTISLDPQLSPSENAQRYFRKYTKQKNSLSIVEEQMELTHEEQRYLEIIIQQVESASLHDIQEIREELVAEGYLRDRSTKKGIKKKKTAKPNLLCYTSSEGIPIYVGKNNTQNEFLTNRLASTTDTWLHTKDIPGSHVVIRGTDYSDLTLEEASMLAAHFSQASGSSLVPVDYTQIRYVRKPSGAKPGFVIYDHQKTLFITPDEARLKALPVQTK